MRRCGSHLPSSARSCFSIRTGCTALSCEPCSQPGHVKEVAQHLFHRCRRPKRGLQIGFEDLRGDGSVARQSALQQLTEWALHTAIQQCRAWRDAGIELAVAVNISARNLHGSQFVDTVETALRQADVSPCALVLEVTESAVMIDPERAAAVITQLDALGISVSIDDFDTGYSSLSYLKRLPAEELKIDKSFVMDLDQDEENRFIVRAAVALAHDLGLVTVAEGIESQRVWDMLTELGCDRARGYYLSRPMPPRDFTAWLMARYPQTKRA